ncbi:DUF2065 family protein [Shimia ponticola]|uniref:DUF2065 family protein n=1 Tax=Shimia ponticola TaxID=2582893 RepID=UPI0011BEFB0F|nr:DUF2065 family protein [Shimia ponticola]
MSWLLLGLGLVLMIEGLVYALAPSVVEDLLEALRQLPIDQRRVVGFLALALGVVLVLGAVSLGL